jgi:hypothetical protein
MTPLEAYQNGCPAHRIVDGGKDGQVDGKFLGQKESLRTRYLAIHPPRGLSGISEKVEDRARDQIEYTDEDPMIRKKFESELTRKGLKSLMPDGVYRNRDYEWRYTQPKAS